MRAILVGSVVAALGMMSGHAQLLPPTAGETLNGKHVVLAEATRGHATVLVASFSREAGAAAEDWLKALRADSAFASVDVYQLVMLEQAPGFLRGVIKNAMRKGQTVAQKEHAVVLTQDEKQWRAFFGVTTEKEPYVVLLDRSGRVVWHGHGLARDLETLVRAALR